MKKSLIALAALSAFATAAQAQSSVSVYGVVDLAVATTKNDAATAPTQVSGLINSTLVSNRLGFKGTEDLGGGLKANFVLEGAMDLSKGNLGQTTAVTSGPASLTGAQSSVGSFNRGAWVGLSSATLGELRVGRQDITNQSNFFAAVATTAGNLQNSPITFTTADRDQVINYISPTFQGFQLQVGHGSANTVTTTAITTEQSTGSVDAVALQYSAGNLTLVAGQAEQKAVAAVDNLKDTMYAAKYNFGFAEVSGGIHNQKESDGGSELKGTMFSIAAPVAMLGSNVKAHYAYVDLDHYTATSSTESHRFALTKAFSKRTTGYVAYTSTKLKTTAPTTPTSFIFGAAHTF